MIIKLASGELRDEIPYSFSLQGVCSENLAGIFDPKYFEYRNSWVGVRERHSIFIESAQIRCEHPTIVSLVLFDGNSAPMEIANWTAVSNFLWAPVEANRNRIDINPLQAFGVRATPVTTKFGEVLVVFNGRLRRPV